MVPRPCASLVALSLIVPSLAIAQAPMGGDTPQAVIAGVQKAIAADDFVAVMPFIAPDARRELVKEGVSGLLMVLAFSDPDDAMPGSKPLPKAELEKQRKAYKAAVKSADTVLSSYGITGVIGKPVLADATQKPIEAALAKADTVAMMRDLMAALDSIGPQLGMKKSDAPKVPFKFGTVRDYKVNGNKATAKDEKETLDFVKIDGRWYLTPPTPPQ